MSPLEAALRQISTDLNHAGVTFALIGGLAVSVRTEPRFTRDADLAVALPSDVEVEALIRTLQTSGYGIEAIVEQAAVGRLATARLIPSSHRPLLCRPPAHQRRRVGGVPGASCSPLGRHLRRQVGAAHRHQQRRQQLRHRRR